LTTTIHQGKLLNLKFCLYGVIDMKILLSWLSDYIETALKAEQIAEILSNLGLPCESIRYLDGDTVIDVEVTSNRGDCLSYIGIARELSVATGKELEVPEVKLSESEKDVTDLASVEIAEPDLCGRYTARIIESVKVGPSPNWLKKRIEAVGLRSVSNVVDATNYAMMETGQPPHAFDYAKITKGKIIVRKAIPGERVVSIDGTQCDLDPNMLIIADTKGPVAIAGVMGGLETEVSDNTKTILLEDAYFDPVSVRATSRKLALPSEAAFRFERIVDIEMIDWASKRTAQLITQVAGGKVVRGVVDVYPKKPTQKQVTLRLSRLEKLLGIEVPTEKVLQILRALGFKPSKNGGSIMCTVPSWRSDIHREADLIEEVARVYGYDKVPTERKIEIEAAPIDNRRKFSESLRRYLNGCGFFETINVGFVEESIAELFASADDNEYLRVSDVSKKGSNLLRQTLLGSLLATLKTNLNAGNRPCRIFEIADTFVPTGKKGQLPIERAELALVCDSEFRDLRGVIEGLVENIDKQAQTCFNPSESIWADVGAEVKVNGKKIGMAGIFSKTVRERLGFKDVKPCGVELDFEQLISLQKGPLKVRPVPKFPSIRRDLSIVVDEAVRWSEVEVAVKKQAPDEMESLQFVGIYRGEGVPSGKKSVTLSLIFRDQDGTLTHDMVDKFQTDIVQSLAGTMGAELRTV
jgi:phenylalanyl-tRNA synthetase beta chain